MSIEKNRFIRTDGSIPKKQAELSIGRNRFGYGTEKDVYRTSLKYTESDRRVDGLVFKTFASSKRDYEYRKSLLEDELETWNRIKEINRRRKKAGQSTLSIPGTVRGMTDEEIDKIGILMTDVSDGGEKEVRDLPSLSGYPSFLTPEQWSEVRKIVEQEIAIAEEEGIVLGPRMSSRALDPWVISKKDDDVSVHLVDVGRYTSVYGDRQDEVTKNQVHLWVQHASRSLDEIDAAIGKQWKL